ncbi:hypothetical protein [Methylomonas sp. AM2-LC]|uniref:hypothetical protein n=1 Tax=Methylomonas sp. AM2-LC TaxID=3153301 RepID=UPI0032656F50
MYNLQALKPYPRILTHQAYKQLTTNLKNKQTTTLPIDNHGYILKLTTSNKALCCGSCLTTPYAQNTNRHAA